MSAKSCRNLERVLVYGLVAVLMAAFSFIDLPVSEAVADQYGSLRGILGALYGETPFTFLSAVSSAILFRFRPKERKWANVLTGILFLAALIGFSFYGGYLLQDYPGDYGIVIPTWVGYVLALPYGGLALLIAYRLKPVDKNALARAALIDIIYFVLVVIVLMLSLKALWGRPRFRYLISPDNDGYSFQPWYVISPANPNSSNWYSFPSGHTMNATGLFCLALFYKSQHPVLDLRYYLLRYSIFAFVVLVAVSRVYNAAHFGSDVTAGFFLGYLVLDLLETFLYPRLGRGKRSESGSPSPPLDTPTPLA